MPEGFEQLPLPAPARWNTAGWKGMRVSYDELAKADDPEALIEALFESVYELLAPTLKGDRVRGDRVMYLGITRSPARLVTKRRYRWNAV